jgi:tRNA dimethylallyltransferase
MSTIINISNLGPVSVDSSLETAARRPVLTGECVFCWSHISRDVVNTFLDQNPVSPLLVIVGPTASGKTSFSIELALFLVSQGLKPRIINADSRQLYQYMDIGTAKITSEEMKGIPHELLSVLDPKEPCSIAWYQKEANEKIALAHQNGEIPLLVGGSMLYVTSVIDGFVPLPTDPVLRERLSREYDLDGGITLYQRLSEIDPVSAASIPRANKHYVLRAMEIFLLTGKPKSDVCITAAPSYDLCMIGIDQPKEILKERIVKRIDQQFRQGWIQEVQHLLDLGYSLKDPGLLSYGYPEIIHALESRTDPALCKPEIARQGNAYAKRARTWWKREPRIHWFV